MFYPKAIEEPDNEAALHAACHAGRGAFSATQKVNPRCKHKVSEDHEQGKELKSRFRYKTALSSLKSSAKYINKSGISKVRESSAQKRKCNKSISHFKCSETVADNRRRFVPAMEIRIEDFESDKGSILQSSRSGGDSLVIRPTGGVETASLRPRSSH